MILLEILTVPSRLEDARAHIEDCDTEISDYSIVDFWQGSDEDRRESFLDYVIQGLRLPNPDLERDKFLKKLLRSDLNDRTFSAETHRANAINKLKQVLTPEEVAALRIDLS